MLGSHGYGSKHCIFDIGSSGNRGRSGTFTPR
jgi:hypothetical protein